MGANCVSFCPNIGKYREETADVPVGQFDAGVCMLIELSRSCPGATQELVDGEPQGDPECHSLDQPMMRNVGAFVLEHARN